MDRGLLKNGYIKGCSRQAIKGEIVHSFGKDIANHVFRRAMKDAMDRGLVKFGATFSRFKLTSEGYAALVPPKPVKKVTKVLKRKPKKIVKKVTKKKNVSKRKASKTRTRKTVKRRVVKKKVLKKVPKKVGKKKTKKQGVYKKVA